MNLTTGPAIYVGIHGRDHLRCRIIRFTHGDAVVRWLEGVNAGLTDRVHPDDLRQP